MANELLLNINALDNYWVYSVFDDKQLVFMYYGKLRDIIAMRPFNVNEHFDSSKSYRYVLNQMCFNKIEAENALNSWLKIAELEGVLPSYNMYNKTYNNDKLIQSVDTGKYYRSAQDVVRIFHVTQPALSNHLRGVPGYRSVKGLRFRYAYNVSPDVIELPDDYMLVKTEIGGYKTVRRDHYERDQH